MGRDLNPKLLLLFTLLISVPEIQISFSLQRRNHLQLVVLCWSLCILQYVFVYIAKF